MRFWDTSAILPLLIEEERSADMADLLKADPDIVVWWGTRVECLSGFRRLERQGLLSEVQVDDLVRQLGTLEDSWIEVQPTDSLRSGAARALGVHGLRAADSFQLAAALSWSPVPSHLSGFVCLDQRLAGAARREGFDLLTSSDRG